MWDIPIDLWLSLIPVACVMLITVSSYGLYKLWYLPKRESKGEVKKVGYAPICMFSSLRDGLIIQCRVPAVPERGTVRMKRRWWHRVWAVVAHARTAFIPASVFCERHGIMQKDKAPGKYINGAWVVDKGEDKSKAPLALIQRADAIALDVANAQKEKVKGWLRHDTNGLVKILKS